MCICVQVFKILICSDTLFSFFLVRVIITTKYALPQVRKPQETLDDKKREELGRLKKTVNGLINR